jgi:hypothetical protein
MPPAESAKSNRFLELRKPGASGTRRIVAELRATLTRGDTTAGSLRASGAARRAAGLILARVGRRSGRAEKASREGQIAESLAEVTEARRSAIWEAERFQRSAPLGRRTCDMFPP